MRINQVNKAIRQVYMNKAKEGGDLGINSDIDPFAGGDSGFDMSGAMFIDDTQDLTNLSTEDILQPDLNSVDFDDVDTELDSNDGENGDDDEGGEGDEDDDPDGEKDAEGDAEEDDGFEEEDDDDKEADSDEEGDGEDGADEDGEGSDSDAEDLEDEDDNSDDDNSSSDDNNSSDDVKAKKAESNANYIKEIQRLRQRAQAAENSLATLNNAIQKGGRDDTKSTLNALEKELDTVEDAYEEAVMDGDKDKARELRAKRREVSNKISDTRTNGLSSLNGELDSAKREVDATLKEALAQVYKRYPQLDVNNTEAGNAQMINIINSMAMQKRQAGGGIVDSILSAVDEGALLLRLEPSDGESTSKQQAKVNKKAVAKRNKKAVEKRIDAVKKAKRKASSSRRQAKQVDARNVHKMAASDFASKEGREALQEEYGIRFDA